MNNKEYGVKLDVDISKFTKKLTDAQSYTNAVMKDIKDRIKEPLEEAGEATKGAFEEKIGEISRLGEQVGTLTMKYADAVLQEGENSEGALNLKQQIKDLNAEMEKEGEELSKVGDALGRLYDEEEQAGQETKRFTFNIKDLFTKAKESTSDLGTTIDNSLKKGIANIKRFSLSLLGIQSAYSMISKAVHSYMSYDTEMTTKMQANWVALGAIFAPIVEKLIVLFQKLVAYINIFVKAFTGGKVDLISKALKKVEKTTGKTTKAIKGLNKELANIDEITNLNFDQGVGDIDAGGGYDITDALKELNNLKLNSKVVKFFENLGKKMREIANVVLPFLKKHFWEIIGVLGTLWATFKIIKLVEFIAQIKNLTSAIGTGGGLGLVGAIGLLVGVLIGFASEVAKGEQEVAERVKKVKDTATQIEELKEAKGKEKELYDEVEEAIDNEREALEQLNEIQKETGINGEDLYNKVKNGEIAYRDLSEEQRKTYKAYKDYKKALEELHDKENEHRDSIKQIKKEEYDVKIANDKTGESYQQLKEEIVKAWERGELTTEQATDSINNMTAGMSVQASRTFRSDLPDAINDGLDPGRYRSTLQKMGDLFTEKFQSIAGEIGGKLSWGIHQGLRDALNNMPLGVDVQTKGVVVGAEVKTKFAKGNVAYQPTTAEFGEYAGARSNPEITAPQNMMRETLYEALTDALPMINSKGGDTVLYVNGKELARATYQDYKNEETRLGSSGIAVRRVS